MLVDCAKDKSTQITLDSQYPLLQPRRRHGADFGVVIDENPFHLIGSFHGPVRPNLATSTMHTAEFELTLPA